MSTSKSSLQEFQSSWSKTVNWAKAQGVPQSSWYPVYQMDSQRLLTYGYGMSEAERTRAILASANPNNVTPLPTDQPANPLSPKGFLSNVMHDATNIFTGLQPTRLVSNIFDGFKNTLEHPQWLADPEKNTLATWIPGDQLLGMYMSGGFKNLAEHPLMTFLNTLPMADGLTGLVAKSALGDALAEKAGLASAAQIGMRGDQVGTLGLARRLVGNIQTKEKGFYKDPVTGDAAFGNLTVHQRLKNYANLKGVGTDLGEVARVVHATSMKFSTKFQQLVGDFTLHNSKLTPEMSKLAYDLVTKSGKTYDDLVASDDIPVEVKAVLSDYKQLEHHVEEVNLATGEVARVKLPDGTSAIYSTTGTDAAVLNAKANLDRAIDTVDKRSKKADSIADEITANDNIAKPAFAQLAQINAQVQESIKATLAKGTTSALGRRLRPQLPPGEVVKLSSANVDDVVNREGMAQLLGLPAAKTVTLTQARLLNEVYGNGGLIDKIQAAYAKGDFVAMRDLSRTLVKRFNNKSLMPDRPIPDPLNTGITRPARITVSPALQQTRLLATNLYKYGMARQRAETAFDKALGGKYVSGREQTLNYALDRFTEAQNKFLKAVNDHPAATWQPMFVRLTYQKIAETEEGQVAIAKALNHLDKASTVERDTLDKLRSDPQTMLELMDVFTEASSQSAFAGMLDRSVVEAAKRDAKTEIAALRARGFVPHYVPNFSSRDLGEEPGVGTYNIFVKTTKYTGVDATKSRMLDLSNTIYDLHASMTKALRQELTRDGTAEVIDNYIIPTMGYKQSELMAMIERENPTLGGIEDFGTKQARLSHILESEYGMTRFDPQALFGITSRHIKGDDTVWLPKAMLDGIENVVNSSQFDLKGVIATPTRIFRTAILGYSPRFIAHIIFGGGFLMVARNPLALRFMADAHDMIKDPETAATIHATSAQRGIEDPVSIGAMEFHKAGGKQLGNLWAQETMAKLNLDPSKMSSYLKVIPQLTFKLTNYVTDMQRAMVYLDGAAKADRRGFYVDPVSGDKVAMTDARAAEEGMRAANKVLGDLSAMSPFERNMLTTVMPFYGWTRHIIQYVATYPVDHPYRAMFLANLANMNSDSVSRGLYTRIQNLFFLGTPDANGNVSAIDTRALNPLRDVANYATLGGLISALNPVISMPFATVDPQIIFGSNVAYPTLTYNDLYGTKEASASGSALSAAEQFVPELTTLDAALGLSAQYRSLRKNDPEGFAKVIFQSLNIPFAQVQHINLKQIAATQELDRYAQANTAAQNAFDSGDFGTLAGYTSVPNPLQADYNVSPSSLEELYKETLAKTGLPPAAVLPPLPAPTNV